MIALGKLSHGRHFNDIWVVAVVYYDSGFLLAIRTSLRTSLGSCVALGRFIS